MKNIRQKFENLYSPDIKEIFQDCSFILSQRQPKNLLRHLTSASFNNTNNLRSPGIYKCNDKRCKICSLYLQAVSSFNVENNFTWHIKKDIDCHSTNVIYFLKCNMCNGNTSYIGKTKGDSVRGFKVRMNQHISESRTGSSSCKFPQHVYDCGLKNNCLNEPYFKIFIMMKLNNSDRLEIIERHLQLKGYDTMNRT